MARPIRRRVTDYDDFGGAVGMKLGDLYEYTMFDYPAFKDRENKGKRWLVAAKEPNGNITLIKSPNVGQTLAEYKKRKAAGTVTGETSVVYENVMGQLNEGAGLFVVWKGEEWIWLGSADLYNPVTAGILSAIGNFFNPIMSKIKHPPWELR